MTHTITPRPMRSRLRRGVIRVQLLVLLLLSSASGLLAQQLWDQADRLTSEYRGLDDGSDFERPNR